MIGVARERWHFEREVGQLGGSARTGATIAYRRDRRGRSERGKCRQGSQGQSQRQDQSARSLASARDHTGQIYRGCAILTRLLSLAAPVRTPGSSCSPLIEHLEHRIGHDLRLISDEQVSETIDDHQTRVCEAFG